MKSVTSTLLFAGTFVAIPLIGFSLLIGAFNLLNVQLALSTVTVNLNACATSVEALAAAVTLDPQRLFANASFYILEINSFNAGLERLIPALPILDSAVASIKTSSGTGVPLAGSLDGIAVDLNDIAGGLISLTLTVVKAAGDSQLTLINTDNLKQDLRNSYTNLVKIATDVEKTADAIKTIATASGNGYVNTIRFAIIASNIIGAMQHAAEASSRLSVAFSSKVSISGGAAAFLTQTAGDLNVLKGSLKTTAGALYLP